MRVDGASSLIRKENIKVLFWGIKKLMSSWVCLYKEIDIWRQKKQGKQVEWGGENEREKKDWRMKMSRAIKLCFEEKSLTSWS